MGCYRSPRGVFRRVVADGGWNNSATAYQLNWLFDPLDRRMDQGYVNLNQVLRMFQLLHEMCSLRETFSRKNVCSGSRASNVFRFPAWIKRTPDIVVHVSIWSTYNKQGRCHEERRGSAPNAGRGEREWLKICAALCSSCLIAYLSMLPCSSTPPDNSSPNF